MAQFVVTRGPGPAWDPAVPTREQAGWDPHAQFIDALSDEGFIAFGGPVGREGKVVLVCDASDETTIRARLERDPWTSAGLLRILAVDPWTIWLGGVGRIEVSHALYLVAYGPGPHWDPARARRDQDGWDAHAGFLDGLTDDGVVVLGGPLDDRRALLVMRHDDEDALRAKIAADPWAGGVLTIESVEPWRLWLPPRAVSRA